MLNKRNLEVAKFCSKEESRYTLQAIQVTPEATVATDGHRLIWVSVDSAKSEQYPVVPGQGPAVDEFKPFLLSRETALKAAQATPTRETIPVLNHAGVTMNGESPCIVTTDLENAQVFPVKPMAGTFPNYSAVMPRFEKAKFRFCVNAEYLEAIAKFAKTFETRSHLVMMSFYGEENAMRFDACDNEGQAMTAVLMPMRGHDDVQGSYGFNERVQAKREKEEALDRAWDAAHVEKEYREEQEADYLNAWSEAYLEDAQRKQMTFAASPEPGAASISAAF